jgi:hypothetical protein
MLTITNKTIDWRNIYFGNRHPDDGMIYLNIYWVLRLFYLWILDFYYHNVSSRAYSKWIESFMVLVVAIGWKEVIYCNDIKELFEFLI